MAQNTFDFAHFWSNLSTILAGKVDKVSGKGLSTEDFTTAEKTKLSGIESGAEVNVQANWSQTSSSADDFIKNKPTLGTAAEANTTTSITSGGTGLPTSGTVYTDQQRQDSEIGSLVDRGAKNLLNIAATSTTINGVAFTVNSDGSITVTGTNTGSTTAVFMLIGSTQANLIPNGIYMLTGCPDGGSDTTYDLRWYSYSSGKSGYDRGSGAEITKTGNTSDSNVSIVVRAGATVNNKTFYPMICTAEDWAVSQKFVPYCPSMAELYAMILAMQNGGNS